MADSPLLPLYPIKDPTVMQWQVRWKAILDRLIKTSNIPTPAPTPTTTAVNLTVSGSSGFFSTSSTSFTPVTNLSVSIATKGGPVQISIQPDTTVGGASRFEMTNNGTHNTNAQAYVRLNYGTGSKQILALEVVNQDSLGFSQTIACVPSLIFVDNTVTSAPGTYTYSLDAAVNIGGGGPPTIFNVYQCIITAYELGT